MTEQDKLQADLRRRHLLLEEQLTVQKLYRLGFMAGAGGGIKNDQLITGTETVLATFTDQSDDTIKWFVAAPREGQLSQVFSTGLSGAEWNRWGVESLVSGQYCMAFDNNADVTIRTYIFVEADGTEQGRLTVTSTDQSIDINNQRVVSITDWTNRIFYTWGGVTLHTDTQVLADATSYQIGTDYHRLAQLSHIILKVVTLDEEEREVETFYTYQDGVATQVSQNTPAVSGFTIQVSAHELSKWLIIQTRSVATGFTTHIGLWDIETGGNRVSGPLHLTPEEITDQFALGWFGPNAEPLVWSQGTNNLKVVVMSPALDDEFPAPMPFYDFAHGGGLTYNQYSQLVTRKTNAPGSGNHNPASTGWIITNIGTSGATNEPPISGNLTGIDHMHMIYQFAGGPVRSFSLSEVFAENQPLMVNDTIIWPIIIGSDLKFIRITADTPDLSEITGPEDLLPYAVTGLGFGEDVVDAGYQMLEVNGGVLVKFRSTAEGTTSTTLAVISTDPANTIPQNYIVQLPNFNFEQDWNSQRTGAGPYVFYSDITSGWVWTANPAEWTEVTQFAGAGEGLSSWDQRAQWHAMGRDDINFVFRIQNGESDTLWAISPTGIVNVPSPATNASLNIRVGENGFYAIWQDADRDDLYTISHYLMTGQLVSTTETLYDAYDSRNYRGSRAIIDLDTGPAEAECAVWIGGPGGAELRPLDTSSVSYYSI